MAVRLSKPTQSPGEPAWVAALASHPPRVTFKQGAELLRQLFGGEWKPRTLEDYPLPRQLVNGRATFATRDLCEHVQKKLDGTPVIVGGCQRKRAA